MNASSEPINITFHGDQRVTVRKAGPADLFPLLNWADVYLQGDYFFRRGHLAGILKNSGHDAYAIEVDEQMAGMMIIYHGTTLHNLYLAPAFRKGGIGTALVRHFRPEVIRAKTNMLAGDPHDFYARQGYVAVAADPNRPHILEMRRMTPYTPRPLDQAPPAAPQPPSPQQMSQPLNIPTTMTIGGEALKAFVKFCKWQVASERKRKEAQEIKRRIAAEYAARHLPPGGAQAAAAAAATPLPPGTIGSIADVLAACQPDYSQAGAE
jgi:GNAT superfamily N-acetyltransferase